MDKETGNDAIAGTPSDNVVRLTKRGTVYKKKGVMKDDPNKPLNHMQKMFVEEYPVDMNGKQAAIRAGYAPKSAEKAAWENLRKPHIMKALSERQAAAAKKTFVTPEWVLNKIAKTIAAAEQDGKHNEVLRGCELLGRHHSLFVDRTEISGHDGEAIELKKVQEDVESFTSTIASLAARNRKTKEA